MRLFDFVDLLPFAVSIHNYSGRALIGIQMVGRTQAKQYKPNSILFYTYIMDVCICDPNTHEWTSSVRTLHPAMRDAYAQYKERPHYYRETPYTDGEYIVYRPDNDPYLPTYIARMNAVVLVDAPHPSFINENGNITREMHDSMERAGGAIPIIDLADISVFITDSAVLGPTARANWFPSRAYQAWAYRDFVYDRHRSIKKSYVSRNTPTNAYIYDDRILANQIVTLPDINIDTHVIFNMSRNENGSVYLERNNAGGSRTRICDNEYARAGYLGFYTRITMDVGMIVTPPPSGAGAEAGAGAILLSTSHISAPEETDDERHQCILCVRFRVNTRFSPCEHKVCCSECYSQLSKNECPVCRAEITRVMNV